MHARYRSAARAGCLRHSRSSLPPGACRRCARSAPGWMWGSRVPSGYAHTWPRSTARRLARPSNIGLRSLRFGRLRDGTAHRQRKITADLAPSLGSAHLRSKPLITEPSARVGYLLANTDGLQQSGTAAPGRDNRRVPRWRRRPWRAREVEARLRHLAKILAPALPFMWPGAMIDLWQAASAAREEGPEGLPGSRVLRAAWLGCSRELSRWPACGCGMLAIERFQAAVVLVANGGVRCPRERAVMPGRGPGAATGVIAVPGAR